VTSVHLCWVWQVPAWMGCPQSNHCLFLMANVTRIAVRAGNVAITVAGSLVDFSARTFQDSLAAELRTKKPGEIKTLGVRAGDGVVVDVCCRLRQLTGQCSWPVERSRAMVVVVCCRLVKLVEQWLCVRRVLLCTQ
jgi:hypothetical protein